MGLVRSMAFTLHCGDCFDVMPMLAARSVNCCVTSPPYFRLRDYGHEAQLGLEPTPAGYIDKLVAVFRHVRRLLRDDGTLWLNLGDSYAGGRRGGNPHGSRFRKQASNAGSVTGRAKEPTAIPLGLKSKDLIGIPWRVAFALQADGWYLRSDIIWAKPNPMPESVRDRPTRSHEYIFLLSKSPRYFYDSESIFEPWADNRAGDPGNAHSLKYEATNFAASRRYGPHRFTTPMTSGRNKRDVWAISAQPFPDAHFATFPEKLVEPCVLAGCPAGGTVLDPFMGSGTVGVVACRLGRDFIGIDLNREYVEMARRRIGPVAAQLTIGAT